MWEQVCNLLVIGKLQTCRHNEGPMNANHPPPVAADDLLDEVLAAYLKADEGGQAPDRSALLTRHPGLAGDLTRFFAGLDRVEQVAAPLRAIRQSAGVDTDAGAGSTGSFRPPASSTLSAAPPAPAAIPGYENLGELGRGGMGIVYKAQDTRLKRLVAVKQMLVGREASPALLARFQAEAEAVARLQHPHIVQVYQAGEHDGQPFFVLEYVPGGSLDRQVRGQPQPVREAVKLVLLLARAVHAAHQAGVIHRDLKPANVLLAPPADEPGLNTLWGCPKVSDFGLARLRDDAPDRGSVAGMVIGTPNYMAPEQAEGRLQEIGPATDVWALGVILYQLLTGRRPFEGESVQGTLHQVCTAEPQPLRRLRPEVDEAVAAVVAHCLRKQPRERYPSAAALADDLKRFLDGQVPQPRRRRVLPWLAAAVVVVVLLTAAGVVLQRGRLASVPATAAKGTAATHGPFKGWIDILVSEPHNPRRQRLRLHEPWARPLRTGDEVRVEAVLDRPGFLYVVWIDARGKVIPIYPWEEGDWQRRPAQEERVQKLMLPQDGGIYPIEPSPEGLETLLLLARETPLERDVDLPNLLGDLGPQAWPDLRYVAWFQNGAEVTDEPDRAPSGKVGESSNPAVRTQQRVRQRLGERFVFTRAVSFGNQGK
jgi:serine/threonine protein kinase